MSGGDVFWYDRSGQCFELAGPRDEKQFGRQACGMVGLWDGRHVGRQARGMAGMWVGRLMGWDEVEWPEGRDVCRKASGMAGMLGEADLWSASEKGRQAAFWPWTDFVSHLSKEPSGISILSVW